MIESAEVILWGRRIGFVIRREGVPFAEFEYAPDFVGCGVEPSPIEMPVATGVYKFPSLPNASFHGLPGLLSDSVPDKFGNAVIDVWLEAQGRLPGSLSPIERLCYTGSRGMGALEYRPSLFAEGDRDEVLHVAQLAQLADDVLRTRREAKATLTPELKRYAPILRVGASAGLGEGICRKIIDEVREAVLNWLRFADETGVREDQAASIDRLIKGIVEF